MIVATCNNNLIWRVLSENINYFLMDFHLAHLNSNFRIYISFELQSAFASHLQGLNDSVTFCASHFCGERLQL